MKRTVWSWAMCAQLIGVFAASLGLGMSRGWAAGAEREPMTMKVVAVNPSADKPKTVPVRIDLPQEIRPTDIIDHGDLQVEYDTERSLYYVYKQEVTLAPKQMRVFEVVVRDVWFVPDTTIDGLHSHTELVLSRLEKSDYYTSAKELSNSIFSRLDEIKKSQTDDTISRKQRIGGYRRNLQALDVIKEDINRMEKLLSFAGGPPVPQMLEESPLKSDAPSTKTTWLVIFLIVMFMGLLAGQFFFTWHRRAKSDVGSGTGAPAQFPQSGAPSPELPVGGRKP